MPTRQILGEVQPNIDEQLQQIRDLLHEVQEQLRNNDKTAIEKILAGKIQKYGITLDEGELLKLIYKDNGPNPFVPEPIEEEEDPPKNQSRRKKGRCGRGFLVNDRAMHPPSHMI